MAYEFQAKKCVIPVHRDVVILEHAVQLADGSYLLLGQSKGAEHEPVAAVPKSTRAHVYVSGWHIVPTRHGCSLTYIMQADMKGLPTAILNIAGVSQPMLVRKIEMHLSSGAGDELSPLGPINLACSDCFADLAPLDKVCPCCSAARPEVE